MRTIEITGAEMRERVARYDELEPLDARRSPAPAASP